MPPVDGDPGEAAERPAGDPSDAPAPAAATPSLAGLGIAGVSRRRIAWIGVAALAAWVVAAFAGQAATGAQANADLAAARERNVAMEARTAALRRELQLVTEERWVLQEARAYQLGTRHERPFALAPDAPGLPPDAPGSPARRLGAEEVAVAPLEAWLEVLFGPSGD